VFRVKTRWKLLETVVEHIESGRKRVPKVNSYQKQVLFVVKHSVRVKSGAVGWDW
jgi:hypothetical protein